MAGNVRALALAGELESGAALPRAHHFASDPQSQTAASGSALAAS